MVEDEGRQLLEEFDGLDEEVRGTIASHRLEFDEDAPVGAEAEAVLGEAGGGGDSGRVAPGGRDWGDPDVGVQVEAVEGAWSGPREVRCPT